MKYRPLSFPAWQVNELPTGKVENHGPLSLSDVEVLSLILQVGNDEEDAIQLARRILAENDNNFMSLRRLSIAEWQKYKGIGEAKAKALVATMEAGRRAHTFVPPKRFKIHSSLDLHALFVEKGLQDLLHEEFWVAFLNRKMEVIAVKKMSQGGTDATVVDQKIVWRAALEAKATSLAIAHNHPSGNCQPSQADITLTKNFVASGKAIEINVIDHLIIGAGVDKYYSFADEGML